MIKNERQYRITKAEAEKFQQSLSGWDARPATGVDPIIHAAQKTALESQLRDLKRDLEEYESLRAGRQPVLEVGSFEEFPSALVKARIAVGLSQKELADRLGLKEQQIQRYEATDYTMASHARMMEVVNALGVRVRKEVFLPSTPDTRKTLLRRLETIGFDRQFVERRLVPNRYRGANGGSAEGADGFLFHTAIYASRVLGVPPATLLGPDPLAGSRPLMLVTRFKVPARANEQRFSAYTVYAHYLAMLMLEATVHLPRKPIPIEANEVRAAILAAYGVIDLASTLRFIWDHGVPVLPLNDPGAFHGACWRTGGRNVIALKRRTMLFTRWLHLALHEFRHAGEEPESSEFTVIEENDTPDGRRDSHEEKRANKFAADVLLDGRAEELVQECVDQTRPRGRSRASGQVEQLKAVVPQVAARAGVSVEALAEYLAYRLTFEGINWWGAATNLQNRGRNPWLVTRDIALEKIDFSRLNPTDRELLTMALTDTED